MTPLKAYPPLVDQSSVRANLSLAAVCLSAGILVLWGVWALFDEATDQVFYSFRSFGLISPLVGLVCLVFSVGGLIQAKRMRGPKRLALAAIVLGVVIGVVPFLALPFDPS
jgi:prepilin signal peptidase PulO-like enzyme (type II secretory pathway)